jgi:hypothetical protein
MQVDPSGLVAAAQRIAEALADVVGGDPAHPPLGADPASAGGAARLSTAAAMLLAALGEQTLGLAATAAQLLNVSAGFVQQDLFNKSGLEKLGVPDAVTVPGWAPPSPPIPPDLRPPLLPPPPLPGEVLSTAVHSGDPHGGEAFVGAWMRVASSAEAAADVVRSAADRLPEAWDSPVSTDTVRAHLYRYADAFDDSASRARTLTQQASWHGEQNAQARSDIPPPQQFSSLRQQIQTVSAANIASGGKYAAQLNSLLGEKTALDANAVDGYGTYHAATDKTTAGEGDPTAKPGDAARDPLAGEDSRDPGGDRDQMTPEKAGQLAAMLPQMMSAVLGAAGGLVGGAFGSLGKVPETLMQAGSQMGQSLGGLMKPGLDTGGAEKFASLDKAADTHEGLGVGGRGGGGAGTMPAGGGGSTSVPPGVRPTTGPPPKVPTMPAGGLPAPAQPSSPAGGSSGMMPMGMPLGGLAGAAHGAGAAGQGGQEPAARPKKVVVPPEPHTESVTGKVNADRIALSGRGSAGREPPDDDPPAAPRPVVRRITMPSRDDET